VIQGTGALICCTKTDRYLFLLRNGTKYGSTWGLPGGGIERGELPSTALSREIHEELGGTIKDAKLIPIETFTSNNGKFSYCTFLITVDEEFVPILNDEHRGYAWVSLADHPKPLHPGVWRTINFTEVSRKLEVAVAAIREKY